MKKILISVGSMTYAIKSRKLLSSVGIEAKVVKSDAKLQSEGCSYGIEINYSDYYGAIRELRNSDIPYSVKNN